MQGKVCHTDALNTLTLNLFSEHISSSNNTWADHTQRLHHSHCVKLSSVISLHTWHVKANQPRLLKLLGWNTAHANI